MKCVICHGDSIEKKNVREECRMGNDLVYVPIEVLECANCGERYYDRKTKRYLEEIQEKISEKNVRLEEIGKVLILAA
jgi:YgiT-type zinc finger domain-containing protein